MQIDAKIGFDRRFPLAYAVTVNSLKHCDEMRVYDHHSNQLSSISPILLPHLYATGEYTRATTRNNAQMFDEVSGAPMSTEFAISRFFIPYLSKYRGWTLFCDSDFLFRKPLSSLIDLIDDRYAVMCVKHEYDPTEGVKMDGQAQTRYARKNWSSMMLINNAHPKNHILTPKLLNELPGRDLHGFLWLDDNDIGELPVEWNWLEGHSDSSIDAAAVHFTRGTPDIEEYANAPYSDEWQEYAKKFEAMNGIIKP